MTIYKGKGFLANNLFVIKDCANQHIIVCYRQNLHLYEIKDNNIEPNGTEEIFQDRHIYSAVRGLKVDVKGYKGNYWDHRSPIETIRYSVVGKGIRDFEYFLAINKKILCIFGKNQFYSFPINEQLQVPGISHVPELFEDTRICSAISELELHIICP